MFNLKDNLHSSTNIKVQYFYRLLSSGTFFERLEYWQQAILIIKDNFFSGIGLGNWITDYPKYGLNNFTEIDVQNGRMIITNPHNDFLHVLTEIGFLGFLCYLGIFGTVIHQAYWLTKNELKNNERKYASYFLFFIFCYLIIAFFDFPLDRIEHQIVLLTVFLTINAKYQERKKLKNYKISFKVFLIACFILLSYCFTVMFFRIIGEKHLFNALEAEKIVDNETVIHELTKAKNPFFLIDSYTLPLDWHIGKAYYNQNNFLESLKYYQRAQKVNPNNIVVNNDLATTLIQNQRVTDAIIFYKKALQISPNYEDARLNLAATYFNLKKYDTAFETIDKSSINPKNYFYKQVAIPIVEKKLNIVLSKLNNTKLNNLIKSKIKSENELLAFYFEYKKNNLTFDNYVNSLTN